MSSTRMASLVIRDLLTRSRIINTVKVLPGGFETRSSTFSYRKQHQYQFSRTTDQSQHRVLYDGKCPLCVKEVSLLKIINRGSVDFIDITEGRYDPAKYHNITYEDAMSALHVLSPDTKIFIGMDGTRELYRAAGYGWMTSWTELPGIRPVADSAYRWFAVNRHWLTGRQDDGQDCPSDTCAPDKRGRQKKT